MAMPTHRRATEVSVAPTQAQTDLHEWVQQYWKAGAVAALALLGFLFYRQYAGQQDRARQHASWDAFRAEISVESLSFVPQLPPGDELATTATSLTGTPAGAWVRALEVKRRLDDRDFARAEQAIAELRRDYPDHTLVTAPLRLGSALPIQDTAAFLDESVKARTAWDAARPALFANPPLAEGSPRVRIVTSAGSFVVGLDRERAPAHVENFMKLCTSGFYDRTKFHRIQADFMIQGGDPNSREGAPETWGEGGPEHKLTPEPNPLRHFAWVLSTAKKPGDAEESGSQFFVTVAPSHHLDGEHTVFGVVTEGTDVVKAISLGQLDPAAPQRPREPVSIERIEVL